MKEREIERESGREREGGLDEDRKGGRKVRGGRGSEHSLTQAALERREAIPGVYRGTSLTKKRLLLGPYSGTMPRVVQWTWDGVQLLMSEVALFSERASKRLCITSYAARATLV
jgi:hypothetical protein